MSSRETQEINLKYFIPNENSNTIYQHSCGVQLQQNIEGSS